jgi:hypothetical protein
MESKFNPGDLVHYRGQYSDPFVPPSMGIVTKKQTLAEGFHRVFIFEFGKEIDINEECLEKV